MSTQEASKPADPEKSLAALQFEHLTDEFKALWPAEWQDLPKAVSTVHQYLKPDGETGFAQAIYFGKKCKGEVPTWEEIEEVRDACLKDGRKPVAMLGGLGYVKVVDFPPDEEPTVKEFFDRWSDRLKNAKTVAMLLIYPCMEI